MKRLVFASILVVAALPLHAMGFWINAEPGLNRYSHGNWRVEMEADAWNGTQLAFELDAEGSGTFYGGELSAGITFNRLLVGVGVDQSYGSGRTVLKGNDTLSEDIISVWEAGLLTFNLPVAYRINFRSTSLIVGLYPTYNKLSLRDTVSDSVEVLNGFGYGAFAKAYYMFGHLGIGGGLFLNYAPELKSFEEGEDPDLGHFRTTWIIKGNLNVSLRLGIFYTTEIL